MSQTVTKKLMLFFPKCECEKPIIYHLVKDHNLIVNVYRAKVTPEEEGYLVLDVTGTEEDIQGAMDFVKTFNVTINCTGKGRDLGRASLHALRPVPSPLPDRGPALRRPSHAPGGVRRGRVHRVPGLHPRLSLQRLRLGVLIGDLLCVRLVILNEAKRSEGSGVRT